MRKALVFAVLALFLAVSAVSSIHAASYPSDALLPIFRVLKAEGYGYGVGASWIDIRFECEISNFEELTNWWELRGLPNFRTQALTFYWTHSDGGTHPWMTFVGGMPSNQGNIGWNCRFPTAESGKWVTLKFQSFETSGLANVNFVSELYFCDVNMPLTGELPVGVWTDLQFKQTGPVLSPLGMNALCAVAIIASLIIIVAVSAKRKKH